MHSSMIFSIFIVAQPEPWSILEYFCHPKRKLLPISSHSLFTSNHSSLMQPLILLLSLWIPGTLSICLSLSFPLKGEKLGYKNAREVFKCHYLFRIPKTYNFVMNNFSRCLAKRSHGIGPGLGYFLPLGKSVKLTWEGKNTLQPISLVFIGSTLLHTPLWREET